MINKNKLKSILSNTKVIGLIVGLLALMAGIQALVSGTYSTTKGYERNYYNNYTIFAKSFDHLIDGKDLYISYPEEHWDIFKYSPSFAAFFGIFSIFPDWIGLNLWNFLNAFILLFSVYYLPKLNRYQKGLVLILLLIELMTSMQNEQSNALIAGLMILTFGLLEKDKFFLAVLCVVFSVFIKLFGIVGFALVLFYQKKWKLALYSFIWTILIFSLPLFFIDIAQYKSLLLSWVKMLSDDQATSYGFSVMGWLHSWFGIEINKLVIVFLGAIIFSIPFFRISEYKKYSFKLLTLASILIWVVIFNHKAESPTFIIAMSGASIWFVISKKSKINLVLFLSAFILASLSPTDIFPRFIREEFVVPYTLKAFPLILIWLKITYDLLVFKENTSDNIEHTGLSGRSTELGNKMHG